jgi:hypothetical protein
MRGARVMIVQVLREPLPKVGVRADSRFEKLFLDIARQLRPEP